MIADMEANKKIKIGTCWIFYERKYTQHLNIFKSESYFAVPKTLRFNAMYFFFFREIPNKIELQQITLNYSSDIEFKDFMKLYIDVLKKHFHS